MSILYKKRRKNKEKKDNEKTNNYKKNIYLMKRSKVNP
jgi:hypothetical protein